MAMNYYAIQIFHARLKVKILKSDVNLGRSNLIIKPGFHKANYDYDND